MWQTATLPAIFHGRPTHGFRLVVARGLTSNSSAIQLRRKTTKKTNKSRDVNRKNKMDKSLLEDKNRTGIYVQESAEVTAAGEGLASQEAKSPVTTNVNYEKEKRELKRQPVILSVDLLPALDGLTIKGTETSDRPPSIGSQTEDELLMEPSQEETMLKSAAPLNSRQRSSYRSSKRFVETTELKDPATLSSRDKALLKKHRKRVRNFERQLAETATAPKGTTEHVEKSESKGVDAAKSRSVPKKTNREQAGNNSTARNDKGKVQATSSKKQQANARKDQAPASTSSGMKPGTSKRPRSEETVKQDGAKKQKTSSFDTTPIDLQIAIISRDDPDGKISAKNWLLVENEILKAMMATAENDSSEDYTFDGAGWRRGVKVVCCGDQKSREFLNRTIANIGELWEGSSLDVLPAAALPLRQQFSIWIPPPAEHEDAAIIKLLAKQNKELPILEWKLQHSRKSHGGEGKDLLFVADKKSDLLLRERKDVLRYGLGTVKVRRHEGKGESKAASGANKPAPR